MKKWLEAARHFRTYQLVYHLLIVSLPEHNGLGHGHITADRHNITPRPVKVSGYRYQYGNRTGSITGINHLVKGITGHGRYGFCPGIYSRNLDNFFRGQSCNRFGPGRTILLNMRYQPVKPITWQLLALRLYSDPIRPRFPPRPPPRPRQPDFLRAVFGLFQKLIGFSDNKPHFVPGVSAQFEDCARLGRE